MYFIREQTLNGIQGIREGNLDHNLFPPLVDTPVRNENKMGPLMLVVDDDPIFCRMIEETAKQKGITVQACRNLSEVAGLAEVTSFDVAILDYCFGELTALQVGHLLEKGTPIVLVSGNNISANRYSDWSLNINCFVPKERGTRMILDRALSLLNGKLKVPVLPIKEKTETVYTATLSFAAILATLFLVYTVGMFATHSQEPLPHRNREGEKKSTTIHSSAKITRQQPKLRLLDSQIGYREFQLDATGGTSFGPRFVGEQLKLGYVPD